MVGACLENFCHPMPPCTKCVIEKAKHNCVERLEILDKKYDSCCVFDVKAKRMSHKFYQI